MINSQQSIFITLEGIEGVGKSTQATFVSQWLESKGLAVVQTREPGGTLIGEKIRQVLLNKIDDDSKSKPELMDGLTELLLLFAGRRQHIINKIKPALAAGKAVVCDRFTDATLAYQGGGREMPMSHITSLRDWVHPDLQPDLTLLLNAPVKLGLERVQQRGNKDRIEEEAASFFERVQKTYLQLAEQEPERFVVIDASVPLIKVQHQIASVLTDFLESRLS